MTTTKTTREEFSRLSAEMSTSLAGDLHTLMMKAFDALTPDEVASLDTPDHPYFLVRSIGVAVGPQAIDDRFNVEAIKGITRRVKGILKRRYW